jgi:hypothetical protein
LQASWYIELNINIKKAAVLNKAGRYLLSICLFTWFKAAALCIIMQFYYRTSID